MTTEYAHRWNSYGLQHVMDIEYIGCAMRQRDRHGKDEGKAQQMEIRGRQGELHHDGKQG